MNYQKNVGAEDRAAIPDPDGLELLPADRSSENIPPTVNDGFGDKLIGSTLEGDVGPEVYRELVAVFLGHLLEQLAHLQNAAAVGDVAAARYVAHQIKGTAADFDAVRLYELADRLLGIGRDQGDLLQPVVDEIAKEVRQLQPVLGPFKSRTDPQPVSMPPAP